MADQREPCPIQPPTIFIYLGFQGSTMYAYKSIVLSGNPGSGKSVLAMALSKKYGWPVHSMGGLWRNKYKELHPKGEITFEEFWGRTTAEDSRQMNEQAKKILDRVKKEGLSQPHFNPLFLTKENYFRDQDIVEFIRGYY